MYWLFEAKKRFGLCILNFTVTSNHVHLLVYDIGNGQEMIPKSIKLIASKTGQEFNALIRLYDMMQGTRRIYYGLMWHVTSLPTDQFVKCVGLTSVGSKQSRESLCCPGQPKFICGKRRKEVNEMVLRRCPRCGHIHDLLRSCPPSKPTIKDSPKKTKQSPDRIMAEIHIKLDELRKARQDLQDDREYYEKNPRQAEAGWWEGHFSYISRLEGEIEDLKQKL